MKKLRSMVNDLTDEEDRKKIAQLHLDLVMKMNYT